MAQTVLITLTTAGADTGPFNLYSNIDGYIVPFESSVAKIDLEAGYLSTLVPDSATTIRVQSNNPLCSNFIDLVLPTTTTTTTTITPITTTTTTSIPVTYTLDIYGRMLATTSDEVIIQYSYNNTDWNDVGASWTGTDCLLQYILSDIPQGSMLYIRAVNAIGAIPVEFDLILNTTVCPSAISIPLCVYNYALTESTQIALIINVVTGNLVPC